MHRPGQIRIKRPMTGNLEGRTREMAINARLIMESLIVHCSERLRAAGYSRVAAQQFPTLSAV
jgi:hypothetical protein